MELYHYSFNDIDSLVIAATDLRKMYSHLCVISDQENLKLTVEVSGSWIFDHKIDSIIQQVGGQPID